jgi:hypothetical protein
MAFLDITKLPPDINRWEELHLLSAIVLTELVGALVVREAEPNQYSSGIVYAATMPLFNAWDQSLRVAPRVSLPMDPKVYTDRSKRFWKHVITITEQATPVDILIP